MAKVNLYLWGKLLKRRFVLEVLQAGNGLWFEEDLVGTIQLLYKIKTMYISSEYLYYYVDNEGQITKKFKPSLWENAENCWKRINMIDTNHYLTEQLTMRTLMVTIFVILQKCKNEGYEYFKEYFLMILNSDIVVNAVKNCNYKKLDFKDRVKYIALKMKWAGLAYLWYNYRT